jgi:putative endonuclease
MFYGMNKPAILSTLIAVLLSLEIHAGDPFFKDTATLLRLHPRQQAVGKLYVGMTNLEGRIEQHRRALIDGFTKKYGATRLVYYEEHDTALSAIRREKRIKKWPRQWKINLICANNPYWNDLANG